MDDREIAKRELRNWIGARMPIKGIRVIYSDHESVYFIWEDSYYRAFRNRHPLRVYASDDGMFGAVVEVDVPDEREMREAVEEMEREYQKAKDELERKKYGRL